MASNDAGSCERRWQELRNRRQEVGRTKKRVGGRQPGAKGVPSPSMIGNKLPNKRRRWRRRRIRKKKNKTSRRGGIRKEDGEETLAASSMASQRLMAYCRQMTDSYISDIDDGDDDENGQRTRPTGKRRALATFFFLPFYFLSSLLVLFRYPVVILFYCSSCSK